MSLSVKQLSILGWIATFTACLMYVSYIPQIIDNLNGNKTSPVQPLAAAVNCTLWVAYGLLKEKKDYPLSMANAPGVIFGLIAFITAII